MARISPLAESSAVPVPMPPGKTSSGPRERVLSEARLNTVMLLAVGSVVIEKTAPARRRRLALSDTRAAGYGRQPGRRQEECRATGASCPTALRAEPARLAEPFRVLLPGHCGHRAGRAAVSPTCQHDDGTHCLLCSAWLLLSRLVCA